MSLVLRVQARCNLCGCESPVRRKDMYGSRPNEMNTSFDMREFMPRNWQVTREHGLICYDCLLKAFEVLNIGGKIHVLDASDRALMD